MSQGVRKSVVAAYVFLTLAALLPLWSVTYVPTQDGPDHLNTAFIFSRLAAGEGGPYAQFFTLDQNVRTNTATYRALGHLIRTFGVNSAEKLLLSAYVISFMLAAWCAVRQEKKAMAVLFFPFVLNVFVNFSFHGFLFSVCGFLFYYGALGRWDETMRVRHVLFMAATALATYLFHYFSVLLMVIYASAYAVATLLASWRQGPRGLVRGWNSPLVRAGAPLAALVPALCLYLGSSKGVAMEKATYLKTPLMLGGLITNSSLYSFTKYELAVSALLALTMFYSAYKTIRVQGLAHVRDKQTLLAAAVILVLYVLTPDFMQFYYVGHRLNLYFYLLFALWLTRQDLPGNLPRLLKGAAVGVGLTLLGVQLAFYTRFDEQLKQYMSVAEHIAEGSTVLTVSFAHKGVSSAGKDLSARTAPMQHASGRLGVERRCVTLDNYEADKGFSLVKFRPDKNPNILIGPLDNSLYEAERFDLEAFGRGTGGNVDYVLLWGRGTHNYPDKTQHHLFAQLGRDYDRIFVSDGGLAELYRCKP